MYFAHTAIGAACMVVLVLGQITGSADNDQETRQTLAVDTYTYIALIDIVFKDNSKRTCTGAIVHENIVITAAHCFSGKDRFSTAKPELTASFVVIGTKKMFETGYEQYLPIEKIVTHPKHIGWTADLALVYTFAAMTSNKPGTVIPLAGESTSPHLDTNVTIYSWGEAHNNETSSWEDSVTKQNKETDEYCSEEEKHKGKLATDQYLMRKTRFGLTARFNSKIRKQLNSHHLRVESNEFKDPSTYQRNSGSGETTNVRSEAIERQSSKKLSRYLTKFRVDKDDNINPTIYPYKFGESYESYLEQDYIKQHSKKVHASTSGLKLPQSSNKYINTNKPKQRRASRKMPSVRIKSKHSWRRSMGPLQNRLFSGSVDFVNIQTCKALVEKAMPSKFQIGKSNDAICYNSIKRCIDENDSGAPAVRHGQLVALTVGGAEYEGDHVAIGLKMNCYCSWISDNLPAGSPKFKCCENCCDIKHKEAKDRDKRKTYL